ncbi:MAG: hypothetical protein M5R36_11355 [Deltaproteobacteria bacterium]|nr:hypothetical protein [Deltaproteobacteria bacterium]
MKEAVDRGLFLSYLQVYVENGEAIRFYEKRGYVIVRGLPSFYGAGKDGLLMMKDFRSGQGGRA